MALILDMPMQDGESDPASSVILDLSTNNNNGGYATPGGLGVALACDVYSVSGPGENYTRALPFDNETNQVANLNSSLTATSAFTIAFFCKTITTNNILIAFDGNSSTQSLTIFGTGTTHARLTTTAGNQCNFSTAINNKTNWQHYAFVRSVSGGAISLYVNGVAHSIGNETPSGAFGMNRFGGGTDLAGNGHICGIKIYDEALTNKQIVSLSTEGGISVNIYKINNTLPINASTMIIKTSSTGTTSLNNNQYININDDAINYVNRFKNQFGRRRPRT